MKKASIIVAGGSGQRMNTLVPKQFLPLKGKPVLMHTIEQFYTYDNEMRIVLVLPESQLEYWNTLCKEHAFSIAHTVVHGGSTRFYSVQNGLALVGDADFVAVHDGVRPLVSQATIQGCFETAIQHETAVPVIDLIDSIREVSEHGNSAKDRTKFKSVQTPQVFSTELLNCAYQQAYSDLFTDDASVVEALGHDITLAAGNRENIKITTEIDMIIAEVLI